MKYLLLLVLPIFTIAFLGLFYPFTTNELLGLLGFWILHSGLGVSAGMHRVYSHKTHRPKPWLNHLLAFASLGAGQGSAISWVAVHRNHHRFSDTEKDLHSPIHGKWNAWFGWYRKLNEKTINHRLAVDLLRDPLHVFIHKHYFKMFWTLSLLWLGTFNFDWITWAHTFVLSVAISLLQDNSVNLFCHLRSFGYRRYDTKDMSVNIAWAAPFTFGQSLHHNHHAQPATFSFSRAWWELDLSLLFLPLLRVGSYRDDQSTRSRRVYSPTVARRFETASDNPQDLASIPTGLRVTRPENRDCSDGAEQRRL